MKNICTSDLADLINKSNNLMLTAHIGPDGDSIGSTIGLRNFLNSIGKQATVVMQDDIPEYLNYLDTFMDEKVISINESHELLNSVVNTAIDSDTFIICDLNSESRLGKVADVINQSSESTKIMIDHHQDPKSITDYYYGDTDASSTCLLIYRLIKTYKEKYGLDFTEDEKKSIAYPLYTGIFTDSGGFQFQRTTPELFVAAAFMINWGADPVDISRKINSSKKLSAFRMQGIAMNNMRLYQSGKVAITTISPKDFDSIDATSEDKEGIVNLPLMLETVQVAALLTQSEKDEAIKVSFRSKGPAVNKVAESFGGGGHTHAAAARVSYMSLDELKDSIVQKLEKVI